MHIPNTYTFYTPYSPHFLPPPPPSPSAAVSKEQIDKGQDTLRTSAALAEFTLSLPPPGNIYPDFALLIPH